MKSRVIDDRATKLGEYIVENKATVRRAAKQFGVSKSTGAQGCLPTAEIPGQRPLPGREERAGGEQGPAAHPGRHGHQKEIPGHEIGKKRCPGAFRASFLRPYTVPSSTAWGSRATPSRRTSKWRWGSSAASKGTAVTTPSCWPMVTTSPGFTKKFSPTPQ